MESIVKSILRGLIAIGFISLGGWLVMLGFGYIGIHIAFWKAYVLALGIDVLVDLNKAHEYIAKRIG